MRLECGPYWHCAGTVRALTLCQCPCTLKTTKINLHHYFKKWHLWNQKSLQCSKNGKNSAKTNAFVLWVTLVLSKIEDFWDYFFSVLEVALFFRADTMAKKRRFTTEIIARNILRKFFVSLIWSVILMITVTIWWVMQSHQFWSRLDWKQKN